MLGTFLGRELEAIDVASELAVRYEEIDLLYTISEILGRTVKLDEAARTIARELADVAGARRASIMIYDEQSQALRLVAGRGLETYDVAPVKVDDTHSIAAKAFRDRLRNRHDGIEVRFEALNAFNHPQFTQIPEKIVVGSPPSRFLNRDFTDSGIRSMWVQVKLIF